MKLDLLSYRQAAEIARVSDRKLRGAVYSGSLPAFRIGATIRIDRGDLERWILAQRRGPSVPKQQQTTEAGR